MSLFYLDKGLYTLGAGIIGREIKSFSTPTCSFVEIITNCKPLHMICYIHSQLLNQSLCVSNESIQT